jgi:hypothetical protein
MDPPSCDLAMPTFILACEPGYLLVVAVTGANLNDGMRAPKVLA